MSIAFLLVFGGFILVIAGVKNVSVLEAARGNFDVPKPTTTSSGGVTLGGVTK